MKISTMLRLNPDPSVYDGLLHRIVESDRTIEARKRLKRLKDMGFDEVLLISHSYAIEDIERARDLV